MVRYIERDQLRQLLASSDHPLASELASVLASVPSNELVSVEKAKAAGLLPTYETRLAAAEAGLGPRTHGLGAFVEALRDAPIAEMFAVSEAGLTGIGLLSPEGEVVAITLVRAGG